MSNQNNKQFIVALDQGTTSSRAIVLDRNANVVTIAQREFAQIYPQPSWVEHDPMEIWATQSGVFVEALAQAAALLAFETMGNAADENSVYYFVGIDGARFKRPVEPGDQLFLDVFMDRNKGGIYKFKARAMVGEELAVEAELMCTVRKVA